ncbi:hypothetical protein HKCCE3408_18895 [Rhodobacterales bacterium HKCCE3408]|nr:hypothetical protein [Rhodobacterales bacterium HKCCE3408]
MAESSEETEGVPRELRFLKGLVTLLTAVMIVGLITVVALLVIRLNGDGTPTLVAPEDFTLPEGVTATGWSQTGRHVVVTGDDGVIRVYDAETRDLTREINLSE